MRFASESDNKVAVAASRFRQEKARSLFESKKWDELWRFKKTCKKSWEALSFNAREIESIQLYKPDWI
jgi:hypothetical protein